MSREHPPRTQERDPHDPIDVLLPAIAAWDIHLSLSLSLPAVDDVERLEERNLKLQTLSRFDELLQMSQAQAPQHVSVPLSDVDVYVLTQAALGLPTSGNSDPRFPGHTEAVMDFRRQQLRAARTLLRRFKFMGGNVDPELLKTIEEELR
jgi:hypothetical protein